MTLHRARTLAEILGDAEGLFDAARSFYDKDDRALIIVALAEFERHILRRFRATLHFAAALDSTRLQFSQLLALARSQNVVTPQLGKALVEFEKLRNRVAHDPLFHVGAHEVYQLRRALPDYGFFQDMDFHIGHIGWNAPDGLDLSAESRALRGIVAAIDVTLRDHLI